MKRWHIFSIIALFVASIGLSATASHADEIGDLKKRLKFLEAQKEIVKKLDSMQSNINGLRGKIDGFQKQLDDFRAHYGLKSSTPSKPAPQKQTQSASKEINFEWIMDSLSKEKRTITGLRIGDRPFAFSKKGDGWRITQQINGKTSPVETGGDNKLVWDGFPSNWPINGTWIFKKASSVCKLNHENENNLEIKWKCD